MAVDGRRAGIRVADHRDVRRRASGDSTDAEVCGRPGCRDGHVLVADAVRDRLRPERLHTGRLSGSPDLLRHRLAPHRNPAEPRWWEVDPGDGLEQSADIDV